MPRRLEPCLELWFVWHFQDQSAHIERDVVQRRSKTLLGCDKALDSSALAMLADASSYAAAKERALLLDRKHAGDFSPPRSNPSSDAYRLIDRIRRGNNLAR